MNATKMKAAFRMLLCVMLIAGVVPPLTALADEQVSYEPIPVPNSGFEEAVSGGDIPGWVTYPAVPGEGTAAYVTNEQKFAGQYSFLLDDQSTSSSLGLISDAIPVTTGKTYLMKAKTFVASKSVRAYIKYYDSSNKEIGPASTALATNVGQWSEVAVEGTVPQGAVQAKIWFYMGGSGTSKAYIDDVTFAKRVAVEVPPLPVSFGSTVDLGEAVKIPLSQAAAYGQNALGENEQYIAVMGAPATFYAVRVETGERIFSAPLPGTDVVWAMTIGSDGNVYMAGTKNGVLFRYNPNLKSLENLGANPSDDFVWDLKASEDGKIYGATYPRSKVFEFDIASGAFADLGTMKEGQQYARGLGVTQDYLYVGIGTNPGVIRYDRHTGEKKEIAVPAAGDNGTISEIQIYQGKLFLNSGLNLYVLDEATGEHLKTIEYQSKISPPSPFDPNLIYYKRNAELYTYSMATNEVSKVEGAPPLPADTASKGHAWITLQQGEGAGRTVLAGMAAFTDSFLYDPADHWYLLQFPEVEAQGVSVNALEADGERVYAGGYQRGMSIFNQETQQFEYTNKAFHQSEGIVNYQGAVYFGTYPGAKLYRYDSSLPIDYNEYGSGNPGLALDIEADQDRPFTMTEGDGKLFIGTFPSYGKLGGALTILEQARDADGTVISSVYETFRDIVPNQSLFGLAYKDGKIYGGTSIYGGLGVSPSEPEAKLFVFDVETRETIAAFTPEIPGIDIPIQTIGELSFGPDGLLWGAIDGTIFAMNPDTYEVVKSKIIYPTTFGSSKFRPFYLRWGDDGLLYTTLNRKLTAVDPETLQSKQLVDGTVNLMALGNDGSIYYVQGTKLFRLPVLMGSVTASAPKQELVRGDSMQLQLSAVLANGKEANLTGAVIDYTSSNPEVVAVNNGVLTAHQAGTADIMADVTLFGQTLRTDAIRIQVTVSTESMKSWMEALEQSGQIKHSLVQMLSYALDQAEHFRLKGDDKQALKHYNDFLKHLQSAKDGDISNEAKAALEADVAELMEA